MTFSRNKSKYADYIFIPSPTKLRRDIVTQPKLCQDIVKVDSTHGMHDHRLEFNEGLFGS
jgi:hypothetical protein